MLLLRIYRNNPSTRQPLQYSLSFPDKSGWKIYKRVVFAGFNLLKRPFDSLERSLLQLNIDTFRLKIVHPSDITPEDILVTVSDKAYEYRSASIGSAGIFAACAYASWAMPSGGWIVLLFKHAALPLFSAFGAARFAETQALADGAEKLSTLIRSGNCDFQKSHENFLP